MTVYFRTPYGRFPRDLRHERARQDWPFEESQVYFPVDVKAESDGFAITALLPGLKAEDVSIQIVNETVTLQGEFKNEIDKEASYVLQERPSGKFCRTITLPDLLDPSKAEAQIENGVLSLHIPKAEQARPKTIKVTSK